MAHEYTKISITSRLAAYMRQFTDIPYSSDIADLIRARAVFEGFLRGYALKPEDLSFYAPIFEARYKSIGTMLSRWQPRQVLELGAGLSPRGIELSSDANVFYLETDLSEVVVEKRALQAEIWRRYRLPPRNNLRHIAANALDLGELNNAANYFRAGQRLTIVHEGLLQYLSSSETERLARNIHELLSRFGGVWITPDFSIKSDTPSISPQQELFRRILAEATERTLYNNAFDSGEHLREYFRGLGFQLEVFNQLYLAPELSSVARLGLDPALIDELRPRLRLWSLTI